jgi:predicted nucleic acid-binding protein
MSFILDASVAAAWVLPDEETSAADIILHRVAAEGAAAPSLLWHELRNILLMAARRGRLSQEEVVPSLLRLRRLPIETVDVSASGDAALIRLASAYALSAYDAAYFALAEDRDLPLATADKALRRACEAHGLALI